MILSSQHVPELISTISSASSNNKSKSTFKPTVSITSEDELSELGTNEDQQFQCFTIDVCWTRSVVRISEMAQEEGDNDRRQRLLK